MSRCFLLYLLASLLLLTSFTSSQPLALRNAIQLLDAPTVILQRGSLSVVVEWETNYNGFLNLHFDLTDYTQQYTNFGGTTTVIQGPGAGTTTMTLQITNTLNLGDVFQLHAFFTPQNYTTQYGAGNDWQYAWANTYPTAVASTTLNATNSMTLLYPPSTIPNTGYVLFDVAYVSNLANYTMLHCDLSDITRGWEYEGGTNIQVPSPSSGVVQFNFSVARFNNGGGSLTIGDTFDVNLYMTSAANNMRYGTGLDWNYTSYSNTQNTVTVAAVSSFVNNVFLVNPPTVIPVTGSFSFQVSYSTNYSGQVILHCDLSDVSANYAYDGGANLEVTGPGTGVVSLTINISSVVTTSLNTSHVFTLHTYMVDKRTSQATGGYSDWQYAQGQNYYTVVASRTYGQAIFDDFIELINPPAWIPTRGSVYLEVAWESSAVGSTQLRIDLSDLSQNYAYGGGAVVTVPSPGTGKTMLSFQLSNGSVGAINQLDLWQFHVYTVSAANVLAYPSTLYAHASAETYVPVVVSNRRLDNYAAIINPPISIPQTGTYTVDLYYVSNLANQTVIHLDINDLSQNWKWFTGTSVTVNSPSSGTVQLTLQMPASLNLTIGDNFVMQYYLTSIWNSTNVPGADWNDFQFEDRIYVQIAPTGSFINAITPVNPPSQIPTTGNFTVQYAWSTNIQGLANIHVDVSDVTKSYQYDGGATIQVEGPATGTSSFTISLTTAATIGDNIQLHAYITPNSVALDHGGMGLDWNNTVANSYVPVQAALPGTIRPFIYSDTVQFYRPPASIPNSGYIEVIVLYSSSAQGSTVIHCDLSDVTQNYAWDGGYTTTVSSPGAGSVTCQIPIVGVLNTGDVYQLHAYTVSAANHTAHPSNEWQWQNADAYSAVIVSSAPLANFVQVLSPPTTIPSSGVVTFEVAYTSNYLNDTIIHLDINDITNNWAWITGAQQLVPSPGSGTVMLTLTLTTAMALNVGDSYSLKAYMTSIANDTAHPGQDWMYSGYDNYNTISIAAPGMFVNSISPLYAPSAIPNVGAFSVTYRYSTNITGLVDMHLDLSDTAWNYITGSQTIQVAGPTQGSVTFSINITSSSMRTLTIGNSFYLHAYMASAADGLEYGQGNDWSHSRGDSVITVPARSLADVNGAGTPYSISFFQNPGTIPASGFLEWTIEWSSPAPVASVLHIDLSDVTQNYAWGGGASVTVPSPGRGMVTMQIPIVGTLSAGDVWQAHAYITTIANATADPGNDWKHSAVDIYLPVVVSTTPLVSYMSLLNPPSTIPTVGTITLDVFYISACANSTNLHVDLSDLSANWAYEGGNYMTVPSPGTGVIQMTIQTTAAMNLVVGHQFDLHLFLTCQNRATASGALDWNATAFDTTANIVYVALPGSFINTLTPATPTYYIPTKGNFTVQYLWSCNNTGLTNFHVDLSDLSANWLWEGGAMIQATCPASGVSPFTIQLPAAGIPVGDSYELHAYMLPTDQSLMYGAGNDWQHSVYDGFTVVQASASGVVSNTLTFVNPVAIIPQVGSFYVTLAYTSNLAKMSNIHIDLSDVTKSWEFEVGSLTQVVTPGSGVLTVLLNVPASIKLVPGDVFQLHAYMASIANATQYGNSTDWQHSAADATTSVTVVAGGLPNQITVVNPPSVIANQGMETFQVIWSSPTADFLNLHCDLSDVTTNYAYSGGSYLQVKGPGSGLVMMSVALQNANTLAGQSNALKIGDNYTLHCYMTNATTTALLGGTSNDWKSPQVESFNSMTVGLATGFVNSMSLLTVPTSVPTSGTLKVQVIWSSNIPGETTLHLDLSDVSNNFAWDGGATQIVASPGSGVVTMSILISSAMPVQDQYELHAYMVPTANSSSWGGAGNDWQHPTFDKVWLVSASGANNGGSSDSGKKLSGGAIAGIVIGSIVGAALLAVILCFFVCAGARSRKGDKMNDGATGAHQRHNDEPSQSNVEMGETHTTDEVANEEEEA